MKSVLHVLVVVSTIVMLIAQVITVPHAYHSELTIIFFGAVVVCLGSIMALILIGKSAMLVNRKAMVFPRWLLFSMALATGVATGIAAKRILSSQPRQVSKITPAFKEGIHVPLSPVQAPLTGEIRSTDPVEALLALPARELYRRLARWLLDADETEIPTFLDRYREQGGMDYEVIRLLYVNRTRLDPQAAIDAATNDEDRYLAWTSWACHAPEAALDADAAAGGAMARGICHAIGQFHPNWLFANFDRIPPHCREIAVQGIQLDSFMPAYPFRTLKHAERWKNDGLLHAAYAAAIRKSPYDAWLWFQEYRISNPDFAAGSDFFLTFLKPSDARDLARIAETMPPGESQRDFLSSSMELLAKADPEAALAEARTAESARTKAEHLAIAGKAFVYQDPEKAFQIADELFAACPDVFHLLRTPMPNGAIYRRPEGERLHKIHPYFEALCVRDPERLMTSFLSHDPGLGAVDTFTTLSGIWAAHDPASHANWLNTQTDPRIREPAALELVDRLASQEQYADALDWSLSLRDADKSPTASVFNKWRRFDPDSALEWLETANLPDERKTQLREGGGK